MKKIILMIVFIIIFTMSGCTKNNEADAIKDDNSNIVNEEENSEEENENNVDDESEKDDTQDKEEPVKISLKDLSLDELTNLRATKIYEGRTLYDGFIVNTEILSEDKVSVPSEHGSVRSSTGALYCENHDKEYSADALDTLISNKEYLFLQNLSMTYYSFSSPYTFEQKETIILLDVYEDDMTKGHVKDVIYEYSTDNIIVNGFICKDKDGYKVIIDPAYMYGIPVYHGRSKFCKYNINGINIEADTISFKIKEFDKDLKDKLDKINSSYVYAKMKLNSLVCKFSIENGYDSEAYLSDYELVSKNTEEILTNKILFKDTLNKDPKAIETYDVIMSNIDTINTDSAMGIVLLDLDFDSNPELLVSRYSDNWDSLFEDYSVRANEVDVYRILKDGILYIDTLYNYHGLIEGYGNVLGLKTLEDGSKAWFNMSYIDRNTGKVNDTDYLFTLEGNNLKFNEVFRTDDDKNYYYMGELMVFEEEPYSSEMYEDHIIYHWNGYRGFYGKWEAMGFAKEDYCKDMENSTFNLYSDWLSFWNGWERPSKMPLTDRMLSYNIAYLVDSYYFGDYDASLQYYVYKFLGGYAKPVIYLYPTEKTDISVKIDLNGQLTCTYPEYGDGWNVTASPDSTIINKADGREYSYLFWEGKGPARWDFSTGFVVKGADTVTFLQDKLEYMGLNTKEINDFIVYWLPLMKHNKYNLISFQTYEYEKNAKLNISPEPDSILRIFMAYKPIEKYVDIPEQKLEQFVRHGFTVIEWGGTAVE